MQSPTPKFFKKLRNISLVLATLGGTLLASNVALPAVVLKLAGFIAAAGTAGAAVSQAVVPGDDATNDVQDG